MVQRPTLLLLHLMLVLPHVALAAPPAAEPPPPGDQHVTLRVYGLPDINLPTIEARVAKAILDEFYRHYPHIKVVRTTGIHIEDRAADFLPLMQIAGNIAPDIFDVKFKHMSTYVEQNFLYPIDEVVDLSEDDLAVIPPQLWPVIKRRGPPDGNEHVFAWPIQLQVRALCYRRDLFQEAGLPDRTPDDWQELVEFARKLTDPGKQRSGIAMRFGDEGSFNWLPFLWSAGGRAMVQDGQGQWRCAFDTDAAAVAALFFTKLYRQRWTKAYVENGKAKQKEIVGVVYGGADRHTVWQMGRIGMFQIYLGFDQMGQIRNPDLHGIGPMPMGPAATRGSEINARMMGIYRGVKDPRVRKAAWHYISFWMRTKAQKVMVQTMVRNGYGRFVQPQLLKKFGYHEYARLIPQSWQKVFKESIKHGKPAPYGKNSQQIYRWMTKPLGTVRNDSVVLGAIGRGDDATALRRIKRILHDGVAAANEKMLGVVSPGQQKLRYRVALLVTIVIAGVFAAVFISIWRYFAPPANDPAWRKGKWQIYQYRFAYFLLMPAVATIALWQYWPLMHGALIAFQDYRVTGSARWTGLDNFSQVLFDGAFWQSVRVGVLYALLVLFFGFPAPIILAILLQELPKGKLLFRTLFYLPAVISGVVVIFLWKSFYGPFGLLNQILGRLGYETNQNWLENPHWALMCCIAPVVWAGMGPGCLIYLAALKTVPDELYESASIDGATIGHRIRHITLPSLKALIIINLIGAVIAAFQSANFILAMTGGGPWVGYGRTEVVGLHIFSTAFFYLKFGIATAMAWIVGLMLIGFTLVQLRKLRNMEFRAAGV